MHPPRLYTSLRAYSHVNCRHLSSSTRKTSTLSSILTSRPTFDSSSSLSSSSSFSTMTTPSSSPSLIRKQPYQPSSLRFPARSPFNRKTLIQTRSAHHASEGRANRASRSPGKRLGAKKQATELVVPGNIIFRQRGTLWFPGENCGMGRDHTIFAKEKGYVVYYREPWRNRLGERKFIGVVFERGETLPRRVGSPRVRRLGLMGRERDEEQEAERRRRREEALDDDGPLRMGRGGVFRRSNASIGRVLDRERKKGDAKRQGKK